MQKNGLKSWIALVGIIISAKILIPNAFAFSMMDKRYLRALDPQTRLEQRCDLEALNCIARETKFRPDKVLAYAFGDLKQTKTSVIANGAAFRAGGKWYRFSYECHTKPDALTVLSFKYKIGELVPRKEWDKHYLVP